MICSEDLKLLIAPDAATLISKGDSLVLETHGKQGSISRLVMRTQIILREKFREVQQAKYKNKNKISESHTSLIMYFLIDANSRAPQRPVPRRTVSISRNWSQRDCVALMC